uniref:Uncharacterized protein n=1 Tax=Meloidogyne hapla TaxID=6305 RepID=A0A1I8BHL2_MELHA
MPDTLELDSSWTVALSNIIYPFSFSLLGDSDEQESITVFRRYGNELRSIHIEIPDLSFASEDALEEALNAVLLDTWKKELERERLEEEQKREEKENEKRRQELLAVGMVWERKRRAVLSIREQFEKHGYFDLNTDELSAFIELYNENNAAVGPEVMHLGRELAEAKKGILLPPISPAPVAVDGIERVRFSPHFEHKEKLKQAIEEFTNLMPVEKEKAIPAVTQQEKTPENKIESPPQPETNLEQQSTVQQESLPVIEDTPSEFFFSSEGATQQLKKDGYADMPKDLAYKFIKYLNKNIKGAKLPDVSLVKANNTETVRLKPQSDQNDLIINAIKTFMSPPPEVEPSSPLSDPTPIKQPDVPKSPTLEENLPTVTQQEKTPENKIESPPQPETNLEQQSTVQQESLPVIEDTPSEFIFSSEGATQQLKKDGYADMPKDLAYKFIKYLNKNIKGAKLPDVSLVKANNTETVRLKPQSDQNDLIINAIKTFMSPPPEVEPSSPLSDPTPIKQPDVPKSPTSEENVPKEIEKDSTEKNDDSKEDLTDKKIVEDKSLEDNAAQSHVYIKIEKLFPPDEKIVPGDIETQPSETHLSPPITEAPPNTGKEKAIDISLQRDDSQIEIP